jgi:uroporphyrin-III C-methyltransferase
MALTHLQEITDRLIAAGRQPDELAALVSRATTDEQRVLTGPLNKIAAKGKAEKIESPLMLVVGDVVHYRDQLDWFKTNGDHP